MDRQVKATADQRSGALRTAGRVLTQVEDALAGLTAILLATITLGIALDVVGRRFDASPFPAIVQVSEYAVFWSALLPGAWILRHGAHVSVDFVQERMPPGPRRLLNIAIMLVGLTACIVATYFAFDLVLNSFRDGDVFYGMMRIPRWVVLVAMPLSFFLMSLEFLRQSAAVFQQSASR